MENTTRETDKINLEKFNSEIYSSQIIIRPLDLKSKEYADVLLRLKFELVAKYYQGAQVLDLCCATGLHLLSICHRITSGTGLDFSDKYIQEARQNAIKHNIDNVEFVCGNARDMPFKDNAYDLVYCFSSLYVMSKVEEVIFEIARVLKTGGVCILDFGNLYSLNTLVCNAHPDLVQPCNIPVSRMKRIIDNSHLEILEHRAFQILPLWAVRPIWLYPFLHPYWKKLLQLKIRGKMVDEWISNLPLFKFFAFRHIFVCRKIPKT